MKTYLVCIFDEVWEQEGNSEQEVLEYFRAALDCPKLKLKILEK